MAQVADPNRTTFSLYIDVVADLTVKEIWPDGDHPENPTIDDVRGILNRESLYSIFMDWFYLSHGDIEINGPYNLIEIDLEGNEKRPELPGQLSVYDILEGK